MNTAVPISVFKEQNFETLSDSSSDEINLLDLWRIFSRYKWSVLGLMFAGLLTGIIYAYTATPIYKATATLLVEPAQPKVVNIQALEGPTPLTLFYETQHKILSSRAIADTVVKQLDLASNGIFISGKNPRNLYQWSLVPDIWQDWFPTDHNILENGIGIAKRMEIAAARVRGNLNIVGSQRSQIVLVEYQDPNPMLAASIANAITNAYAQYGLESRLAMVKNATSWLSERLQNLKAQLEQSEIQLQAFQRRESMLNSSNRRQMLDTKMANLATQLINAQTQRAELEIRYRQVHETRLDGKGYEILVPLSNNMLVERLYEQFGNLERKLSELGDRYGDKHPKMIAAKADRDESERRLLAEINRVSDSLHKDFIAAQAKEQEAKRQLDLMQQDMQNNTGKGFQQAKLEREVESNRQLYETFLSRFKEIDNSGESTQLNVRIVDPALVPEVPFKPKKFLILMLCMLVGLIVGVALAVLRAYLDNTFKRAADIEEKLLLPVLSELVYLETDKMDDVSPERYFIQHPRSAFAETINHVRTGIMFSDLDEPAKSLLVTSAQPGEGKTTLSSNLAISFAQMGKTLLIDADMRKPSIRRAHGKPQGAGLSEWITGSVELSQAIHQDEAIQNLSVMTTGQLPPNPLELLSSTKFKQRFKILQNEYDYIIFDTPPILPVSDALVLGNLVDKVILSVRFDVTTFPLAEEAVKRLRSNHIEPLGAVLSMVDMKKIKSYYGNHYYQSYYGAYYGKYYGEEACA